MEYREKLNVLMNRFKEASELYKLKKEIRNAMFEIEKEVKNQARKDKLINLKTSIKPSANGYDLIIKYDKSSLDKLPQQKITYILKKYKTISIYPQPYFESRLKDEKPAEISYLYGGYRRTKEVKEANDIEAIVDMIKKEIISFLRR